MNKLLTITAICLAASLTITQFTIASIIFADEDTDSIRRANDDGSGVVTLVSSLVAPRGVAVDPLNGKVYWSDGHAFPRVIQRSNLDGTAVETIYSTVTGSLNTIDLDLSNGKIYFANSIDRTILRANFDGSDLELTLRAKMIQLESLSIQSWAESFGRVVVIQSKPIWMGRGKRPF